MMTCESVDLPEPLGPMTACTSPLRTVRSMPRRISLPRTPARRPSMISSATGHLDQEVVAVAAQREHRHRTGGREGGGLAGLQGERGAVLPALELADVGVHLALAQGDV